MAAKVIMIGTGSDYKGRLHEVRPIRNKDCVDGIDIVQDLSPTNLHGVTTKKTIV
jgi:hypothetical protein